MFLNCAVNRGEHKLVQRPLNLSVPHNVFQHRKQSAGTSGNTRGWSRGCIHPHILIPQNMNHKGWTIDYWARPQKDLRIFMPLCFFGDIIAFIISCTSWCRLHNLVVSNANPPEWFHDFLFINSDYFQALNESHGSSPHADLDDTHLLWTHILCCDKKIENKTCVWLEKWQDPKASCSKMSMLMEDIVPSTVCELCCEGSVFRTSLSCHFPSGTCCRCD